MSIPHFYNVSQNLCVTLKASDDSATATGFEMNSSGRDGSGRDGFRHVAAAHPGQAGTHATIVPPSRIISI
jgi:hypothetical protein